ncbi:MAG: hypothetical protein ABIP06_08925 [Pyrinomonadaceae bacterium]
MKNLLAIKCSGRKTITPIRKALQREFFIETVFIISNNSLPKPKHKKGAATRNKTSDIFDIIIKKDFNENICNSNITILVVQRYINSKLI